MQIVDEGIYIHKETGTTYLAEINYVNFHPFESGWSHVFTFHPGWKLDKKVYRAGHSGFEKFVRDLFFVGEL